MSAAHAVCEYCAQPDDHHRLCPMTFILGDPNRRLAFGMGVPAATSDWVDAARAVATPLSAAEARHVWIEAEVLLTQYHDRQCADRIRKGMAP